LIDIGKYFVFTGFGIHLSGKVFSPPSQYALSHHNLLMCTLGLGRGEGNAEGTAGRLTLFGEVCGWEILPNVGRIFSLLRQLERENQCEEYKQKVATEMSRCK
jgi:hypothetical protein